MVTVTSTSTAPEPLKRGEPPIQRFWRRFRKHYFALFMVLVLIFFSTVALLSPWIMPHDPNIQNLSNALAQPGPDAIFGTDELGRDVLSRMIAATTVTMYAGVLATMVGLLLGLPFGLLAGFLRGPFDAIMSRIVDALMAIPTLILALSIVAISGVGVTKAVLAIGVANAPRFFRVARSVALVVRDETYVEAARSVGTSELAIARRHVFPNILSPLIVQISITVGFSILFEASLSFLGLGVQAPDASWGSMLRNANKYAEENPLMVLLPGVAILIVVLAFNTVGDAIRDSLGREVRGK